MYILPLKQCYTAGTKRTRRQIPPSPSNAQDLIQAVNQTANNSAEQEGSSRPRAFTLCHQHHSNEKVKKRLRHAVEYTRARPVYLSKTFDVVFSQDGCGKTQLPKGDSELDHMHYRG